jgi:Cap4 SAVED domain
LSSLAPFLIENESERSERERDLLLLSDKANLSDPVLIDGFKKYFDRSSIESKRVEYKGIALAGFDFDKYPAQDVKGISVRRLPPPLLAGGISGSIYAHSSSVRSLGYLKWSRLYLARFLSVHIGDLLFESRRPSSNHK